MEISLLVAKMLMLLYLSAGIAAISGAIDFKKMMDDFKKSQALTFITGVFTMITGMILVANHTYWGNEWMVIITIIGWIAVFKGCMFMAFPNVFQSFTGLYKKTKLLGGILLLIGLFFGYLGFWA